MPFEFTMVAYDPDHDRLLFTLVDAPSGMTIDDNGTIRWQPTAEGGTHHFTVEVDDGRGDPVRIPVTLEVDAARFVFVAPDGNDEADGTIDAPFADVEHGLRVLATREGGGTLFIRGGTYDIAWNWEQDGVTGPFRGVEGSPEAPYEVRGYPGEQVVLDCGEHGHGLWTYNGSYILHADLEVRAAAGEERGGAIAHGGHIVFQNVTVRDSNWSSSSNCTGFLLASEEAICHRCVALDNYDRESDHWNSSNYLVYADGGPHQTTYILDSLSSGSITGFKLKHAGEGRLVLHGSRDVGSDYGWAGMDDDTTIRFNTFEDNEHGLGVGVSDPNEFTRGGMLLEHNTVVRAVQAVSIDGGYAEDGLSLQQNVLVVSGALGSDETESHFTWIWPWASSPVVGLESDHNCWWSSNDATNFRLGQETMGFAEWQSSSFDANSRLADPEFGEDGFHVSPSSACFQAADRVGAWD